MKPVLVLASLGLLAVAVEGQLVALLHMGRSAVNSISTDHEEPPFTLIHEGEGYEERLYPQRKWVCTNATTDDENRTRHLFYRLFDYITGANSREVKIEMTIPVATLHAWDSDDHLRMCFFVPEAFQSSTPTPTDPRVYILNEPAAQVAVRTFSGYPSLAEWNEEIHALKAALERDGRISGYEFSTYMRAGYDAPWKFYNRRNEVIVVKRS